MFFKKNGFLSLKWKLFTVLTVTFTAVAVGISWGTYVIQEKQLKRERMFYLERNSLELTAQVARTQQTLINRLDYINLGVLQGSQSLSLDRYVEAIENQASKLMLVSGMESIGIVNERGDLLYSNVGMTDYGLVDIGKEAIATERPVVTTSCKITCSVYASIPILLKGQIISVSASAPLTEVIVETRHASGWDVGIYLPGSETKGSAHWSESVIAMTNYQTLMPILASSDASFGSDGSQPSHQLVSFNDAVYEVVLTPIDLADENHAFWLLASDVTSSYTSIKENTLQLLAITWVALLLCALWLAKLAQPNLLGLGMIPRVMKAVARHDFQSARDELKSQSRLFNKLYADELTVLADTTHDMAAELERLDSEMEVRNEHLQKSNMALAQQRDFVSGLLDNAQAIIVVQNVDSKCTSINKFGRLLLGKTEYECNNLPFESLFGRLAIEDKVGLGQVKGGQRRVHRHETILTGRDGISSTISWMHSTLLHQNDEQAVLSIGMDITEQKNVQHQLHWLAIHDPLTELLNRVGLQRKLQSSILRAADNNGQLAVVFCDLDHFKRVNDAFGHPIGDKLLTKVATCLTAVLPAGGILARWGGDEFVVLFENVLSYDDAIEKAMLCQQQLNNVFTLDGKEVFISASVGLSIYPHHGSDATTIIKNADVALFQAKQAGRNQVMVYSCAHHGIEEEKISLDTDLRYALARDELYLQYQPQICANTHKVIGAEALIRWNHPVQGFVPPDRFIPLAEESGQIIEIGEWVIRQACERILVWEPLLCPEFKLSVNIAGPQIIDRDFLTRVKSVIHETGINPNRLELEITETFIMTHPDNTVAKLSQLRELGITLAIDDFGTGYSSLSYLKSLPIDKLKIDKSFVFDIGRSVDGEEIAKAIIALGHSLNLNVIAEGVETAEQAAFLTQERCDQFQGYFFSRPLIESDCEQFLKEQPDFKVNVLVAP